MIKKLIILKDKKIQKKSNIFFISHSVCPNPYTVEEKDYLQNPLKNRKFFDSSYQYISQLYNKVAGSLAKKLNKIHGVNYSKRYWEILFNTWLRIFLTSSYDKWLRVRNLKNKKNFFFETYEINKDELIFKNTEDFTMSSTKEDPKYLLYSYQIYSQILQLFYIKNKKINKKFIIKNNFEKFDQKYKPGVGYLDTNPIKGKGRLVDTVANTNLDVENEKPNGGIPYKQDKDPTVYPKRSTGTPSPVVSGDNSFVVPSIAGKFFPSYDPSEEYLEIIK